MLGYVRIDVRIDEHVLGQRQGGGDARRILQAFPHDAAARAAAAGEPGLDLVGLAREVGLRVGRGAELHHERPGLIGMTDDCERDGGGGGPANQSKCCFHFPLVPLVVRFLAEETQAIDVPKKETKLR
jgi:hypothetical protein